MEEKVLPKHHTRSSGLETLRWLLILVLISTGATLGVYTVNRLIGAPASEPQISRSLRIITWNIGLLPLRQDSSASDDELNYVATVIRSARPHVVALQELKNPTQLQRLITLLGPGWRGNMPIDRYDRRAAILVRLHAHFFNLPTSTGRVAQGAVIRLPWDDEVVLGSVHLDAYDPRRRLLQAEEIMAGIQRIKKTNIILAGDFNFDASVAAQNSTDQDLYRFLTRELVDATKGTGATTLISRRLDYIFYRSSRVKETTARVLRDKRRGIMDHDPVVIELLF